jgi:hypothetical protein
MKHSCLYLALLWVSMLNDISVYKKYKSNCMLVSNEIWMEKKIYLKEDHVFWKENIKSVNYTA